MKSTKSENRCIIRFIKSFVPSCIWGERNQLKELGMGLNKNAKKLKWMWTYESPQAKVSVPQKKYDACIVWNEDGDCCDIYFQNGVMFGYVDADEFKIIK